MASPAVEHGQSDPPPHGPARPQPCGHGADSGHTEPCQRSARGQKRAEHGDGAEASHAAEARPSCADRTAAGSGVSELRIDYGPGYRVYFVRRGEDLIVLLAGGTKDTQARDIGQAITLASEL
jgi:putative addiction module killer protein